MASTSTGRGKRDAGGDAGRETGHDERAAVAAAASDAADSVLQPAPGEAAAGIGLDDAPKAPRGRKRGAGDPLTGEARRELLPLLVLHYTASGPAYGNQLIDRVAELTAGTLTVNPNTMYPLLRDLESKGLIEGQWEHPERRTRRFYTATDAGRAELKRLRAQVDEALASLESSIGRIRAEIAGD